MPYAAVLLLLALAAPIAPSARDGGGRGRFILGAPDRLAMAGDRQHPRRYARIESAVDAYADVDEVADPTWLRHEVEGYARRAAEGAAGATDCGRTARRLGGATVIQLTRGGQAELVWTSGHRAVRLAWRRQVETAKGTMHVDAPPAEFAAGLLAEFPSDLPPPGGDESSRWDEDEIDRRLDYAARALDACAGERDVAPCLYFARASLLAVAAVDEMPEDHAPPPVAAATVISVRLQVAAAQLRRAAARQSLPVAPWCAAPSLLAQRP
jgi:hypothetical protein